MATTPSASVELPRHLEVTAAPRSKHWPGEATATGLFGLSLLAAAIHLLVAPEHIMEATEGNAPWWLAAGFVLTAGLGGTYAAALLAGLWSRGWLAAGIAVNLTMAAVGILGHTTGLPGLDAEPATPALLVALVAELAAVGCAAYLLRGVTPRLRGSVAVVVVLAAAGLALLAVGGEAVEHAQMLGKYLWIRL